METNETAPTGGTDGNVYYGVKKDAALTKKKSKRKIFWINALFIFLSAAVYSIHFHYFVSPSGFAPGGIGGIVAMVQHLFFRGVSAGGDLSSIIIIGLNLPILFVAAKVLSKDFAIKTFFTIIIMTAIMYLFDNVIDPNYSFIVSTKAFDKEVGFITDTGIRLVSAIIGGALCGVSLACALKVNSSTGGADIIGAMVQKRHPHKSVASMIFAVNGVIMFVSVFVYNDDLMPVFLSVIYIYISSVVCDLILQGSKSGLKFEVITEHAEEISKEIIQKLGHGVTITPAEGMFEHKNKNLLICIIRPRQIAKFQRIITKYPDTFAYVGQVSEVIGKFNKGDRK